MPLTFLHWKEWWAELAGTAELLFRVVTVRYWAVRAGPPVSDVAVRITIVGTVAGAVVLGVAGATFVQLILVFGVLVSRRYHQWAAVVASALLTAFIMALAPPSRRLPSPPGAGRPVTGKLRHDPAITCHMRCGLPHRQWPGSRIPRT